MSLPSKEQINERLLGVRDRFITEAYERAGLTIGNHLNKRDERALNSAKAQIMNQRRNKAIRWLQNRGDKSLSPAGAQWMANNGDIRARIWIKETRDQRTIFHGF